MSLTQIAHDLASPQMLAATTRALGLAAVIAALLLWLNTKEKVPSNRPVPRNIDKFLERATWKDLRPWLTRLERLLMLWAAFMFKLFLPIVGAVIHDKAAAHRFLADFDEFLRERVRARLLPRKKNRFQVGGSEK